MSKKNDPVNRGDEVTDIDAPVAADALSRIKQTLELDEGSMPEPDGMHDGG